MRRLGLVFSAPIIVGLLSAAGILSLYPFVHFAQPTRLWWTIGLILLAFVWAHRNHQRRKNHAKLMHYKAFERLSTHWSPRRDNARFALVALAAFGLILAAAQPQWGEETRRVQRKGTDIAIVLDASRSMLAEDVGPNRMKAATRELNHLLDALDGDRVGLVVFAGVAFTQSPLTSDYGALKLYLDRVNPDAIPAQGTALGVAIKEAHTLLTGGNNKDFRRAPNQMILVISDGEDHETNPIKAAQAAHDDGIQVNTIGVGTRAGGRIPIADPQGRTQQYLTDREGNVVHTRLEDDQLQDIASAGGGMYLHFDGLNSTTPYLTNLIRQFDEAYLSDALRAHYVNRGAFFLWPAFLLLLLALWIDDRPRAVRPRKWWNILLVLLVSLVSSSCLDFRYEDAHVRRAIEKAEQEQYDEALEEIERANKDARTQHAFHFNRGRIYDARDDIEEAQSDFLEALGSSNTPLRVAALIGIGNTLVKQGNYRDAITRYTRALLLDPNNTAARRNLEIAHRKRFPRCEELEDALEPNDSPETASDLPAQSIAGTYASLYADQPTKDDDEDKLTLCSGNEDWFQLPLTGGESVEITANLQRLRDDNGGPPLPDRISSRAIRMMVIDARGRSLAVDSGRAYPRDADGKVPAKSITRHIELPHIPPDNAPYYLVLSAGEDLEYSYTLEVEITPPCSALEDDFEPNDRPDQAADIDAGSHRAHLCNDNEDWFQMELDAGEHLFVDVDAQPTEEATDASVRAGFHTDEQKSPRLRKQPVDERIAWASGEMDAPGRALWGFATESNQELSYTMDIHHFAACPEGNDRYEPNDRPNEASPLTAEDHELRHLRLCENDQDWFIMDLQPDPNATEDDTQPFSARVDLPESTPLHAVQVELWDPQSGRRIARGQPLNAETPPHTNPDEHDADTDAPKDDPEPAHALLASVPLPATDEHIIVRVFGEESFYHLSFPDTLPPKDDSNDPNTDEDEDEDSEQEEEQHADQNDADEENSEENDEENSEENSEDHQDDGDPNDADGAQDDETNADENDADHDPIAPDLDDAYEEDAREEAPPSEDELKRQALHDLLNSLEHDDVNLQLQQAIERTPPSRRQTNEW